VQHLVPGNVVAATHKESTKYDHNDGGTYRSTRPFSKAQAGANAPAFSSSYLDRLMERLDDPCNDENASDTDHDIRYSDFAHSLTFPKYLPSRIDVVLRPVLNGELTKPGFSPTL
jgi:hypothetical protein